MKSVLTGNNLPHTAAFWRHPSATPRGHLVGPLKLSGGERRSRHGIVRYMVEMVDAEGTWTLQSLPREALDSYADFAEAIERKTGCSLADTPEDWHRWRRRYVEGRCR